MIRQFLTTLLLTISVTSFAAKSKEIVAGDDFVITLPTNWVAMDQSMCEEISKLSNERLGKGNGYQYGFQIKSEQEGLDYPYILVQVKRTGRVRESELKDIKKIRKEVDKGVDKVLDKFDDHFVSNKMGQIFYDDVEHILWSSLESDLEGIGKIYGLSATKLTNYGAIAVHGYCRLEDKQAYKKFYQIAFRSLKVNEKDQYKSNFLKDMSPGMLKLLVFGVIILASIVIKAFKR